MKEVCPKCNSKTVITRPQKYSPEDKFAEYRRKAKFQDKL
jgi:rRNA maturation protein Nop10